MSTSYTRFNIQDLPSQDNPAETDLLEVAVATGNGYVIKKETAAAIADAIVNDYEYTQDLTTTSKKITGAINEVMSAKADITSLATVATSGAYSDLSGKPTIDTALDDTSTNAVENRAVASEINSIKSDITVEGSASGDIATFVDGSDNPLKELKISIVATQSGTGDPSPTNVRPITGWTGCNIPVRGFNLWDEQYLSGYYNSSGVYTYVEGQLCTKNITAVKPNKEIYIKLPLRAESAVGVCEYAKDGTFLRRVNTDPVTVANGGVSFTPSSDCYGINVNFTTYYDGTYKNNICINVSSSENGTYKPYDSNSETININWQSEAGTVYGGYIKPLTGELIVAQSAIDLGAEGYDWGYITNQGIFTLNVSSLNIRNDYVYNSDLTGFISDRFIPKQKNSGWAYLGDYEFGMNGAQLRITCSDYTTPEAFKNAVNGSIFVYPLATPVTYQLTPTEVRSLLGINNLWADCGSITELKYTRDLNLCINDIIARITALENANSNRSLSVSSTLTKSIVSDSDTAEGKTEETEEETKEEAQNER